MANKTNNGSSSKENISWHLHVQTNSCAYMTDSDSESFPDFRAVNVGMLLLLRP